VMMAARLASIPSCFMIATSYSSSSADHDVMKVAVSRQPVGGSVGEFHVKKTHRSREESPARQVR
jgi:hypothetical protein